MSASTIAKIIAGGLLGAEALMLAVGGQSEAIRPPGAQDESDFNARCIRCGKCIEACPFQSIIPERGLLGAGTGAPTFNMRAKACRLCEDFPCVDVCPTGALRDIEERKDCAIGIAVIDESQCIAFDGMRCEVCYRACPLIDEAIKIDFREREGDTIHMVFAPVIDDEKCVGCGLCVERCVTDEPAVLIVRTKEEAETLREEFRAKAQEKDRAWAPA